MNAIGMFEGVAECIGCGCTDMSACMTAEGPCSWLVVDYDEGKGVCSNCPDHLAQWEQERGDVKGQDVMSVKLKTEQTCPVCKGARMQQHPAWTVFWKEWRAAGAHMIELEDEVFVPTWFSRQGYGEIPPEEIACDTCVGRGVVESVIELHELVAMVCDEVRHVMRCGARPRNKGGCDGDSSNQ